MDHGALFHNLIIFDCHMHIYIKREYREIHINIKFIFKVS